VHRCLFFMHAYGIPKMAAMAATAPTSFEAINQIPCSVIIVTSPIESNPSTELIDRCLSGIFRCFPVLSTCKIIIACDGCKCVPDDKAKLGRRIFGRANRSTIENYRSFLDVLSERGWMECDRPREITREDGSESDLEWLGFALTLKRALMKVTTPLVFVTCHDFELVEGTLEGVDAEVLIRALLNDSTDSTAAPVKYIGLPTMKAQSFSLRHGETLKGLRPILLQDSACSLHLEPLGMWKDSPHFARTDTYRDFVFGSGTTNPSHPESFHVFKRGHFIEDTLGQKMIDSLKRASRQPSESEDKGASSENIATDAMEASPIDSKTQLFNQFGTYLLRCSSPCIYHMDGRVYVPTADRRDRGYSLHDFEVERALIAREIIHSRESS
jgi:hypothetical protein